MSQKSNFSKAVMPGLGLVFGAGAGMLSSVLFDLSLPFGLISGGAAGLLIGLFQANSYSKKR